MELAGGSRIWTATEKAGARPSATRDQEMGGSTRGGFGGRLDGDLLLHLPWRRFQMVWEGRRKGSKQAEKRRKLGTVELLGASCVCEREKWSEPATLSFVRGVEEREGLVLLALLPQPRQGTSLVDCSSARARRFLYLLHWPFCFDSGSQLF
jgi:hypothetical protein